MLKMLLAKFSYCFLLVLVFMDLKPMFASDFPLYDINQPLSVNLEKNTLTISDAIKLALMNNPKVDITRAELEEKKWSISEDRSKLIPHLFFKESFLSSNSAVDTLLVKLHQRSYDPTANLNYPGIGNNFSTRVGGTWTIIDRELYNQVSISKIEHKIQKQLGKENILTLIKNVRQAYLNVQVAVQKLETSIAFQKYMLADLSAAKEKKNVGTASKSDLLSVKVKLATAEEDVLKAKNNINLSWIVLADIVNDENIIGLDLVSDMKTSYDVGPIDKLVNYAYIQRPAFLAEDQKLLMAKKTLVKAKRSGALTFNATAQWGVDTIFDDRAISKSYSVYAYLEKSLYDGGLRKAKIKKAEAKIDKQQAELELARNSLKVEIVQNYLSLKNSEERLKVMQRIIDDAEENYRAYFERYNVGLSNQVELEASASKLSNAKLLKISSLYDFNLALINLQYSLGMSVSDILEEKNLLIENSSLNKKSMDNASLEPITLKGIKEVSPQYEFIGDSKVVSFSTGND